MMPILCRLVNALDKCLVIHLLGRLIMLCVAMLLAFHGFLHCAKFTSPQVFNPRLNTMRGDISFDAGPPIGMLLFLKQSKTDPLRRGTAIEIGEAPKPLCPLSDATIYDSNLRL